MLRPNATSIRPTGQPNEIGVTVLGPSEVAGIPSLYQNDCLIRTRKRESWSSEQAIRFHPPTEDDLREFVDLSLNLLCIAGVDGYLKYVNPAWETTLGYSKEELLSRPYLEFVHPDDREATIAEASHIASGQSTISFENRYVCKEDPSNDCCGRRLFTLKKA